MDLRRALDRYHVFCEVKDSCSVPQADWSSFAQRLRLNLIELNDIVYF